MKTAVFIADPNTRVNQQIALGLAEGLQKHGMWMVCMQLNITSPEELHRMLCARRPDALVMHKIFPARVTRAIANLTIPRICVAIDWQPELPVPLIIPDDEAIGRMAARFLLDARFEHFASLTYETPGEPLRHKVFHREIQQAGKPFETFLLSAPATVDHPFHAFAERGEMIHWLRQLPKPCAIFAHSDNVGALLIQTCGEYGLRIPEDVAVLGVDDDPLFCRTVTPNLASIHVPNARMGIEAASLILNWRPGRRVLKVPPTAVMERASVRLQAKPDPLISMAMDHLRAHPGKRVRVRDLQQLTGLSPQMLVYRFHAAVKLTPMEVILKHRIDHAKCLLAETDTPAGTIARQCGFNSSNRFYLNFRNLVGLSPLEYRSQFSSSQHRHANGKNAQST